MSDWSEQEEDLFCEALSRTDLAKRAAFLDQACVGNSNLRARVEKLLVIHAEAEKFFAIAEPAACLKADDIQAVAFRPHL